MVRTCQRLHHAEFQGGDRGLCIPVAFRKLPRASQLNSICPPGPSSFGVLPSFLLSFLPFSLSFIQRTQWLLEPRPRERCGPPGSGWLLLVSLFHHVEPALWVSSVSRLSHQTEGSPGQGCPSPPSWGSPEHGLRALGGHGVFLPPCPRPPPRGMVTERPVLPCSRGVLGQVCLG